MGLDGLPSSVISWRVW